MYFYPAQSTPVDTAKVESLPVNAEGKDKAPAHQASEEKASILFRTTSGACFRCRRLDIDLLLQLYCFPCSNLTSKSIKMRDSSPIDDPSHVIESAPYPPESTQGGQDCGVIDLARQLTYPLPGQDDSEALPLPADIRCARKICPQVNKFAQCQVLTELSKSLEVACARGVLLNNFEGAELIPPSIECGQWLSLHDLPAHYHKDDAHPPRTQAPVLNKPGVNPQILPEPPTAAREPEWATAGALATPTIAYAQYEAMVKQFGDVLNGFAELRLACRHQAATIDELCKTVVGQQAQIHELELGLQLYKAGTGNGVLTWKLPGFKKALENIRGGHNQIHFSSPFFHTSEGYALYGRIHITGDGAGRGSNISLSIGLMPSLYDPILPWPFRGAVRFEMLGSMGRVIHNHIYTFIHDGSNLQDPKVNPETSTLCVIPISQETMMDKYLVDDDLFIRITVETQKTPMTGIAGHGSL
ncbi:hypothetical protein [Endozoicomonas sp. YOMI1]|uniref:hypothetical protein n=1 Tax=Endozoicomonas sp. YOMI1 TaxID=2828739 RepID=UPI002147722E|nr:hypothetical protein [Endozoicomonas sp. YOMI1]